MTINALRPSIKQCAAEYSFALLITQYSSLVCVHSCRTTICLVISPHDQSRPVSQTAGAAKISADSLYFPKVVHHGNQHFNVTKEIHHLK